MDAADAHADSALSIDTCWCCGQVKGDSHLARLDSRPEVGVCADCARYLHRHAQAIHDQNRRSLAGTVRAVGERVRETVLRHGLQHRPVIGPILLWLDRHTP